MRLLVVEDNPKMGASLQQGLREHGYAVDFVIDGTMTFPIPNWDKPGEELGVDAIRERTEYALRRRFARITTVAELETELKERSKRAAA